MNLLTPFVFENHVAHGAMVRMRAGVGEMFDHRHYAPAVRQLLGEAMAAMPLLATHLSYEGRINLQFQGEGRMNLLVAQISEQLRVRAMAKAPADLDGAFTDLLYGGILSLMLEPRDPLRPAHQAVVLIQGEHLHDALESYFAQSEQLPTLIRLAAHGDELAGFLLQRLPLESSGGGTAEDWEHLQILASTLTHAELLDTDPETLLGRLFADAPPLRLRAARPVEVACNCSRASIARLLQSLGRAEVDSILAEQQQVEVSCEFCGRSHAFSPVEAAALFVNAGPASDAVH